MPAARRQYPDPLVQAPARTHIVFYYLILFAIDLKEPFVLIIAGLWANNVSLKKLDIEMHSEMKINLYLDRHAPVFWRIRVRMNSISIGVCITRYSKSIYTQDCKFNSIPRNLCCFGSNLYLQVRKVKLFSLILKQIQRNPTNRLLCTPSCGDILKFGRWSNLQTTKESILSQVS